MLVINYAAVFVYLMSQFPDEVLLCIVGDRTRVEQYTNVIWTEGNTLMLCTQRGIVPAMLIGSENRRPIRLGTNEGLNDVVICPLCHNNQRRVQATVRFKKLRNNASSQFQLPRLDNLCPGMIHRSIEPLILPMENKLFAEMFCRVLTKESKLFKELPEESINSTIVPMSLLSTPAMRITATSTKLYSAYGHGDTKHEELFKRLAEYEGGLAGEQASMILARGTDTKFIAVGRFSTVFQGKGNVRREKLEGRSYWC